MLGRSGENALTPEHGHLRDHYYDAARYLLIFHDIFSFYEGLAECCLVLVLYMSHEHVFLYLHEF